MNNIGKNYFDIGYLDALAKGNSFLHRLDPRIKIITTLCFIITVVSFNRYTLLAFIPFFIYPLVLISIGRLPLGYLLKKVLLVSPFAILIGIFNPLIDREIVVHIANIGISSGWISFISIILRFILTVTAALLLIALTGFTAICEALPKIGIPRFFAVQLLFFYRYLFVLIDEAQRMERAMSVRSFHRGSIRYSGFVSLTGHLLLRTLDRAERIYRAMCSRGFDGRLRIIDSAKIGSKDFSFAAIWIFLFVVLRIYNVPLKLGEFVTGYLK